MKKKKEFITLIIVFTILSLIVAYVATNLDKKNNPSETSVCFSEVCITAEIAQTQQKIATGLMFRESLPQNKGMLFVFPKEDIYTFWMKNTRIPLDIIWISSDLEIVHLETATPCDLEPCPTYNPETEALYVVEVNAGFVEANGISTGNKVMIG